MTQHDVEYYADARATLDKIENDATQVALWDALCDAIDLIYDAPDSAQARQFAMRVADVTVWQVPVFVRGEDEWHVSWTERDDGVNVVVYVGPAE